MSTRVQRKQGRKRRTGAHWEGYAARVAGLPLSSNPYASPTYGKGAAWVDGWEEADADQVHIFYEQERPCDAGPGG
ncbi:MAG: hypothetical protein ACE5JS_22330 [Nitrospinota bacterium]